LEEQRLGHGGSQLVRALLQRGDLVRMRRGDVVLLGRIPRDVVELDCCGQRRAPDQLPVAVAAAGAKRLHVVDDLRAW